MLFATATFALAALASVSHVAAQASPTSPDASTVVNVGSDITAQWSKDTSGNWTDMVIQMVPLATVGRDIDATTLESYSFAAPEVSPNAAIYFLQFTSSNDPGDTLWTTRFTIAAADGTTTEPSNSTQPGGADIAWGTGSLLSSYDISNSSSSSAVESSTSAAESSSTSESSSTLSLVRSSSASASVTKAAASAASSSTSSNTSAGFRTGGVSGVLALGVVGLVGALL